MCPRVACSSWSPSGSESLLNASSLAGSPRLAIVLSLRRPVHNTKHKSLGARGELSVSDLVRVGFVCELHPIRRAPDAFVSAVHAAIAAGKNSAAGERMRPTVRFTDLFSILLGRVLLAPVGCECLVEAADLAGGLDRLDYALGRGLVVLPLGLVTDPAGLLFIPRFDGPVEALGEVAQAGSNTLVVGATLEALLIAF